MKKFLTTFLFVCSCALVGAAVGCKNDNGKNSSSLSGNRTVTFEEGEGFTVSSNATSEGLIPAGSMLTFEVEFGAFYTGTPIAYVNGVAILSDADGVFSYTVGDEDLVIRVDGVRRDISNMSGSGTMQDAFVVSKPIDLLYIAEQVNKGNRTYATGAYVLGNDIDCKGEELQVIGDRSTPNSVFSGSFACANNADTGEIERYTISNFVIQSEDVNYVGLFGAVFADASIESSGLIYGIRLDDFSIHAGVSEIVQENRSICVGGLVGYGIGANLFLCEATNGEIDVVGDGNYFAYAGGLIGYQQGYYDTSYGLAYPSEISYATVDVDVSVVGGLGLCAGGISGYTTTNYPLGATVSVHNSYSLGSVSGALRCGGIVGGLGQYTVVSNCYATGDVSAYAAQKVENLVGGNTDEYCYAYAGGIVGYGENDSIAHDSFFIGTTSAYAESGVNYQDDKPIIGGGDPARYAGANAEKYLEYDCLHGDDVDLSNAEFLTNALGWGAYDWILVAGEAPAINYESSSSGISLSMTLKYFYPSNSDKVIELNGETEFTHEYFNSEMQSNRSYTPVGSWVSGESGVPLLAQYYTADDDVNLSYGFFFDEACTVRVPLCYFPEKDFEIYVAFADPTPVVGSYAFYTENSTAPLTLKINADGTASYSDGNTQAETIFAYDGETLILENARLTRYYLGEIEANEDDTSVFYDTQFDLNRYNYAHFAGVLDGKTLKLYDGNYFTAEAPLLAYASTAVGDKLRGEYYVEGEGKTYLFYGNSAAIVQENGATAYYESVTVTSNTVTLSNGEGSPVILDKTSLKSFDAFKGSWTKSATVNKTYTFDGKGNWKYTHTSYDRSEGADEVVLAEASGSYTPAGDQITFTHGGVDYVAKFVNGALQVISDDLTQVFYAENSYVGNWRGSGYTLKLQGMTKEGYGEATIVDSLGYKTELLYEMSETKDYIAFYYVEEVNKTKTKSAFYGYASYNLRTNTLQFVLPNSEATSGYAADTLYVYDDFYGDWVTDIDALKNVELEFNGLGFYGNNGKLIVTVDGKRVTVDYSFDAWLIGSFAYGDTIYEIRYNENSGEIEVIGMPDNDFKRKDEFGDILLVTNDEENLLCTLDGRSTLVSGGKLSFKGVNYTYFANGEGKYLVKDENGVNAVGTLEHEDAHYRLDLGANDSYELYITNEFMGDWAISGAYALFHIGPTDREGVVKATYKGTPVELTFLDPNTLTFKYRENKIPYTYYVFVMEDEKTKQDILVLSEYTNLSLGEYFFCSKAHDLFGTWWRDKTENPDRPGEYKGSYLKFDGINSGYVNGTAQFVLKLNNMLVSTDYYYTVTKFNGSERILMWSKDLMAGNRMYYRLDIYDSKTGLENKDVFELDGTDKFIVRTQVTSLYLTEAKNEAGISYLFDYDLTTNKNVVYVGKDMKYSYKITAYNDDNTVGLELTDLATNVKYEATVDYSGDEPVFVLGEQIVENAA